MPYVVILGSYIRQRRVGIAQWYSTGNFSLHHCIQTGAGAHPASSPMGTGMLSLGVKWLECEADHTPPSSAEVKNE